ncbi:MAG: chalcone isomerase family protein [Methylophagaceae bacterium]
MRKLTALLSFILFCISFSVSAVEREGIIMPDSLQAGGQLLQLNGVGVRSKFVFELYVAGLYLTEKSSDADVIIQSNDSMAIRLHIISAKITSKKMTKATRQGFSKATGGKVEPIAEEIETFLAAFSDKIIVGDIFEFVNIMGQGVRVLKNGSEKAVISSSAFKQALFGIWLSNKPVKAKLKAEMLGK